MLGIKSRARKAVAVFAASALSLLGIGGTALVAQAADGNINPDATGSITVHKYQNPAEGTGTIDSATSVTGTAVQGVKFTVTPVTGIDLTRNEGWDALATLTPATASVDTENAVTITTDEKGAATADNLNVGVYLVSETDTTNASVDGKPVTVATTADDFLVSIPMSQDGQWIYNVNVFPKNTVITDANKPVKTVDQATKAYFPGDTITWQITQTLPGLGAGETFSQYKIVDALPAGVNPVTAENITVTKKGVADPTATVTVTDPNTVTVEYTGDALAALKAGDQIVVTIKAVVGDNASDLSNQANVTVNDATVPTTSDPSDPTNPDTPTTFANLTINKVNEKDQALAGATFEITPVADINGTPIEGVTDVNTREVVTSGDAGSAVQNLATGFYKVTETQAPAGYETPTETDAVKYVQVSETGGALEVVNVSADDAGTGLLPNLPLTGAQGMLLLTLIGLAIIAIATGTAMVSARKNRAEN